MGVLAMAGVEDAYTHYQDISWEQTAPIPAIYATYAFRRLVTVINGMVYAFGGVSSGDLVTGALNVYDPATDVWTTKASASARYEMSGFVLNGLLHVAGGATASTGALRTHQVYDPGTNTWTTKQQTPSPLRGSPGGFALGDGHGYIAGGADGAYARQLGAYRYDPVANVWTTRASYNHASPISTSVAHAGYAYVVGSAVSRYDPIADAWTSLGSAPPSFQSIVGQVAGQGYSTPDGRVYEYRDYAICEYHIGTNSWRKALPLPPDDLNRAGSVVIVGDHLYMPGSWAGSNPATGRAQAFRTPLPEARWRTARALAMIES